jgi:alpha-1,4-galacturonosyltransferase
MMGVRNIVLLLLCITVVAPIVLYTDRLGSFESSPSSEFFFLNNFFNFGYLFHNDDFG